MKILKKPFLISIFSGLFLALNFYMLFFYYLTPEFEWKSPVFQFNNYVENEFLFFSIGFIVSVISTVFIGWPLYRLAILYSNVNYVTSSLGGMTVTLVPYIVCIFLGWNIPSITKGSGMIVFFVLFIRGVFSGFIFHFF